MARKREQPPSALGAWVRRVRLGTGLNQDAFGASIGRARGTVADWERGANGPDSLSIGMILRSYPHAEPPPLVADNAGPPSDPPPPMPRGTRAGGYAARTEEARVVARAMDAMGPHQRHEVLRRVLNYLAELTPPPARPPKA